MLNTTNDIIVLDIGGTRIRVGHIRDTTLCTDTEIHSTSRLLVPSVRLELLSVIEKYRSKHSLELKAAVIGIPGILDRNNDSISHCNNIPQLEGQGLSGFLADRLGCSVFFEQDIMLQLMGEWRAGAGKHLPSLMGVYFGTGIGAAYLINGNPDESPVTDIQAGHIPIMCEGRLCKCGNTDCIEAYACGHTLTELADRTACPVDQLFVLKDDVKWRESLAIELDQFVLYQAYMLATICTLLTPKSLVIGGGIPMMQAYPRELLLEKTIRHLQKPYPAQSVKFAWASLAQEASLHGALALLELKYDASRTATQ